MNKFNLTFSGEIIAGYDPARVKLRFAKMFSIDDPVRLERFFSGATITLRRNLERKAAAQYFHELHMIGAVAALVKVDADAADAASKTQAPKSSATAAAPASATAVKQASAGDAARVARTQASDQTWAVSSAARRRKGSGAAGRPAKPRVAARNTAEIAAGLKARRPDAAQQFSQQAERERTEAAEQARRAAEQERLAAEQQRLAAEQAREIAEAAARQQAEAAERARLAAEVAAREEADALRAAAEAATKLALQQEAERKAAADARQREAQREQRRAEQARRKAEQSAKRKAEQAARKAREAEAAARRKAALEERKRQQAIAAAQRQAQLEEKQRRDAEAAARRQAELAEQQRREAEAAAQRQVELAEQQRREAEAAAQRQAALEEQQRQQAEAAARAAELAELQRREAEEEARLQAELAAIQRREAEEAQRLQAALAEQARQVAAQAARIKEEAQRQQQEAQRRSGERRRALAQALAARQPTHPPAPQPTAPQPPHPERRKRPRARIRTALDVPPRNVAQAAPAPRKRQPGEPNLYTLRPFRNTDEVRNRAALARQRARQSIALGIVALGALLLVTGAFLQRAVAPPVTGASAVAVAPQSGPLLLAGDALLLHDRAGLGTGVQPLRELGLESLAAPLAFDDSGALLAAGRLRAAQAQPDHARPLLRCDAPLTLCELFSADLAGNTIDAFAINPVDGSLLLADRSVGLLLKTDRAGAITARAEVAFPERLALRLHAGLLLMNSATAPAISVFRYENNAFGKQLDEILLLPPGVEQVETLRVADFLWAGDAWWVSLYAPGSERAGLYRFDEEWNFRDRIDLPAVTGPLQLVAWGEKILANDPAQLAIARISAAGVVEAPFVSAQLQDASAAQQRRARLTEMAWRCALLLCALAAALGLALGYLHNRRALVYQPRREQGAEPLDEHIDALRWVEPVANREALLRRRLASYLVLALGVLLLAVALSIDVWQLAALLLALSGPALALLLIARRGAGYIGILGDRLLLVDHGGSYHLAGGSRIQYRGAFLCIDDVVVYCGGRLLPAFAPPPIQQLVRPLALGGVKVDRATLLVKLLQSRHPLALGALIIALALAAALAALFLQGIV